MFLLSIETHGYIVYTKYWFFFLFFFLAVYLILSLSYYTCAMLDDSTRSRRIGIKYIARVIHVYIRIQVEKKVQ